MGDFVNNVRLVKLVIRVMESPDKTIKLERQASDPKGYTYPWAEEYLGEDAEGQLEMLADRALLEREFVDKEFGCPHCRSVSLTLKLHCPHCDSTKIERREILEHLDCGFVGAEDKFAGGSCHKCHEPLGNAGVNFVSQGSQHACGSCGQLFQEPVQKFFCIRDKVSFSVSEAPEINLYEYKLMPRLADEINKAIDQQKYIQDKIVSFGFKVQSPAVLTGRSGVEQQFFLIAASGIGFLKMRIVVEIVSDVTADEVFSLYGKANDVGAYGVIFAAVPRLGPDAKKVADSYGLTYVDGEDLSAAAERLVNKFAELVRAPEDQVLESLNPLGLGGQGKAA